MGEGKTGYVEPGFLHRSEHCFAIKIPDGVVADDQRLACAADGFDFFARALKNAALNQDIVAFRGVYMDGFHLPSTSSLRRFPSSSSFASPARSCVSSAF